MVKQYYVSFLAELRQGGELRIEKRTGHLKSTIDELMGILDDHIGSQLVKLEIRNARFKSTD